MYFLSPTELEALCTFVDRNLNNGFIHPSKSPHGAPILFVKKKSGELGLCIDYYSLNQISKKDRHLLPLLSDLLDTPKKGCVCTKIDLCHTYHLGHIADREEWKATFHTHYGSYEWLVVLFSLTNAPMTFQWFMNNIFLDLLDICVIVYLDDILIYSDDMLQHRAHVKEVLQRLSTNGL